MRLCLNRWRGNMFFGSDIGARAKPTPLALRRGRLWRDGAISDGDLLLIDGRIAAIGDFDTPPEARVVDLDGRLVTPGLIDLDHDPALDSLAPTHPGPYLDWDRRAEELPPASKPLPAELAAAVERPLREGVTTIASPALASQNGRLRTAPGEWIRSLTLERNPKRRFSRARGGPVFVSVGDGDSKAKRREMEQLAELDILGPNLIAVGGTALTPADAERLAQVGAAVVWRPVVDEFVLGRTIGPDVLRLGALNLLLGAGVRRDGGQGFLAALRRAAAFGSITPQRLLLAATKQAGMALQLPLGRIAVGQFADLAVWDAEDFAMAVFELGPEVLSATVVNGSIVFQQPNCFT